MLSSASVLLDCHRNEADAPCSLEYPSQHGSQHAVWALIGSKSVQIFKTSRPETFNSYIFNGPLQSATVLVLGGWKYCFVVCSFVLSTNYVRHCKRCKSPLGAYRTKTKTSLKATRSQEPITRSLHLPYKPLESTLSHEKLFIEIGFAENLSHLKSASA